MNSNIKYNQVLEEDENENKNENSIEYNNICIICYEKYENEIIFKCSHSICLICYEKLLNSKDNIVCPVCRDLIETLSSTLENINDFNNILQENNQNDEINHRTFRCLMKFCYFIVIYFIIMIIIIFV